MSASLQSLRLENIRVYGRNAAKWCLEVFDAHQNSYFGHLMLSGCVGSLNTLGLFRSHWEYIAAIDHFDGLPVGMPLSAWQDVHNTVRSAPVVFADGNGNSITQLQVEGCGVSAANLPVGGTQPLSCIYLEGIGLVIDAIEIENQTGAGTDDIAAREVIAIGIGSQVNIESIYLEQVRTNRIFTVSQDTSGKTLRVGNIICQGNCIFDANDGFIASMTFDTRVHIDTINLRGKQWGTSGTPTAFTAGGGNNLNIAATIDQAVYETAVVTQSGANQYMDFGTARQGVATFGIDKVTQHALVAFPSISRGMGISTASVAGDDVVLIEPGEIQFLGKRQAFGLHYELLSVFVGYMLRPPSSAGTWNVCVDIYGGVFLEDRASIVMNKGAGKIVLGTFDTDAGGNISNFSENPFVWRSSGALSEYLIGFYTEDFSARVVYRSSSGTPPDISGTREVWNSGDLVWRRNPTITANDNLWHGWTRLTTGTGNVQHPTASPDWARLYFQAQDSP